jgi:hypothetical protein
MFLEWPSYGESGVQDAGPSFPENPVQLSKSVSRLGKTLFMPAWLASGTSQLPLLLYKEIN